MNDRDFHEDLELVARVTGAFDHVCVPEAPSASETKVLLNRGGPFSSVNRGSAGFGWRRLTRGQRIVLGGIGLSTAALAAIVLVALQPGRPLSAMERMARELREVTSYSYRLSSVTTSIDDGGKHTTTWSEQGEVYWRAPDAFRFEDRITKSETPTSPDRLPLELLERFVEVFPPGKPGVLIDHQRKTYLNEGFAPLGSKTYPWQPLKMIREGNGEVTAELGSREIAGKQARGYVTRFASGDPPRPHSWHVWVDPETGLPLEIVYTVEDASEPRTTTVLRVTDFRWNLELPATLFDPVVPDDYRESAAPIDEKN
jgi:outer membrane lipoprotein-sorting protein